LADADSWRAGAAALSLTRVFPVVAQTVLQVDYTIRIAPVSVELAPDKVIKTYGYNGMVPGPVLRLKEGRQVRF
jgi:FtsP/CotA-like multicopper oxidase with cupredoxin domain